MKVICSSSGTNCVRQQTKSFLKKNVPQLCTAINRFTSTREFHMCDGSCQDANVTKSLLTSTAGYEQTTASSLQEIHMPVVKVVEPVKQTSDKAADYSQPQSSAPAWLGSMPTNDRTSLVGATPLARINIHTFNGMGQDLRRFLEEVGTDAKEARYWLKHFQRSSDSMRPFAVLEVQADVIRDLSMLEKLCSCVAFLHRHDMKCVLVHGQQFPPETNSAHVHNFQDLLAALTEDSMKLVSFLENHGALARPLFAGTNILQTALDSNMYGGEAESMGLVNIRPILWAMKSGHVPIIQSVGQSESGQLVAIDITTATTAIATEMKPLKVMFVNTRGGITNRDGEVIPNVNLPFDLETMHSESWCTNEIREKVEFISGLLGKLPNQSSVVLTSASSLLTELFTHHGSGTFFKVMEPVHKFDSLENVDRDKLIALIEKSFGRDLEEDYLEKIEADLHSMYIIEGYGGAAIILQSDVDSVPYLDKFVVSSAKQGDNAGQMLWERMKKDIPQLYWRSRNSNYINPWYFQRSEGSWTDGMWTVFWYGDISHQQSSQLVSAAINNPSSFKTHRRAPMTSRD